MTIETESQQLALPKSLQKENLMRNRKEHSLINYALNSYFRKDGPSMPHVVSTWDI